LETDSRGRIVVDEELRTQVDHIYAVGDVIGFPALAATSMEQGRLAAYHVFGEPAAGTLELQPIGIYTIPQVSYVGATEVELTTTRLPTRSACPTTENRPARPNHGRLPWQLKLPVSADDIALLGVHAFGTDATELVHGQAVMGCGDIVEYLVDAVFNCPTSAEA
jgi:NAD(P) transhydrogenase